jgi:hypothetical protein
MQPPIIELAPGADENGLANMLSGLVRDNLEAKPHKQADFEALSGRVAIVADDIDVALTMSFERGKLTIYDGIQGIPKVTIRGPSEAILAMSNMPLATPLGLPIPDPRDRETVKAVGTVLGATLSGKLHVYGMALHAPLLMKLTRIMSING